MAQEIFRSSACCIIEENGTYTVNTYTWDSVSSSITEPVEFWKSKTLAEALKVASLKTLTQEAQRSRSYAELTHNVISIFKFISAQEPGGYWWKKIEILPEPYTILNRDKPLPDFEAEEDPFNVVVRIYRDPENVKTVDIYVEDSDGETLAEAELQLGDYAGLKPITDAIFRHW